MKATLTLSEHEIKTAINQYVTRNGWKVGTIALHHDPGCPNDPRESAHTTATVEVEPSFAAACDNFR